jgi:hypothetical protein
MVALGDFYVPMARVLEGERNVDVDLFCGDPFDDEGLVARLCEVDRVDRPFQGNFLSSFDAFDFEIDQGVPRKSAFLDSLPSSARHDLDLRGVVAEDGLTAFKQRNGEAREGRAGFGAVSFAGFDLCVGRRGHRQQENDKSDLYGGR